MTTRTFEFYQLRFHFTATTCSLTALTAFEHFSTKFAPPTLTRKQWLLRSPLSNNPDPSQYYKETSGKTYSLVSLHDALVAILQSLLRCASLPLGLAAYILYVYEVRDLPSTG